MTSDKESSCGNLETIFGEFCKDLGFLTVKENLIRSEMSAAQFLEELAENGQYTESFIFVDQRSESTIIRKNNVEKIELI